MSSESDSDSNVYFERYLKASNDLEKVNRKLKFYKSIVRKINSDELPLYSGKRYIQKHPTDTPFHIFNESGSGTIPPNLYFLTITFDPKRFDDLESVTEESKKEYILRVLQHNYRWHFFERLYGCFEYTKKMELHAHAILQSGRPADLKYKIKTMFASSIDNNVCIDMTPVESVKNVMRYLEKESFDYFYIGSKDEFKVKDIPNPLDYNVEIEEVEHVVDQPKSISHLIDLYDKSQKVARDKFVTKLHARYTQKGINTPKLQELLK